MDLPAWVRIPTWKKSFFLQTELLLLCRWCWSSTSGRSTASAPSQPWDSSTSTGTTSPGLSFRNQQNLVATLILVIFSLLSTIVTYLIIMVQFKMSEVQVGGQATSQTTIDSTTGILQNWIKFNSVVSVLFSVALSFSLASHYSNNWCKLIYINDYYKNLRIRTQVHYFEKIV